MALGAGGADRGSGDYWPRPGRLFAAARSHTFAQLGIVPDAPLPYWGWGVIPDQYGRNWDGDDGESPPPPDPGLADLPPLRPWWGKAARRAGATAAPDD